MGAGKDSGSGGEAGAPRHDASMDDLMRWAGQDTQRPVAPVPTRSADDVLTGRVVQRGQDEDADRKPARRGFPPAWQIALGAIAVWVVVQFVASLLFMLGFVALAVAVVAGAYAIGKSRGGGQGGRR